MTNREKINTMTNEQLATLLVVATEVEETDYDYDDEPYGYLMTQYGNDVIGWCGDYEETISETIKWLEKNVMEAN